MTGFRTLLFNGLGVLLTALLTWLVGVDWTQYVNPSVAMVIVFVANMALRFVTKTAVFKSEAE